MNGRTARFLRQQAQLMETPRRWLSRHWARLSARQRARHRAAPRLFAAVKAQWQALLARAAKAPRRAPRHSIPNARLTGAGVNRP